MGARPRLGRWASIGMTLTLASLLTACSPDDVPGVKLSSDGAPVLVNCGSFYRGVAAYDDDTGRLVWSAAKAPESSEHGVGDLAIGELPATDWTETSAFAPGPRPSTWRFVVDQLGYVSPRTLTVDDAALSADQVVLLESGQQVPAATFMSKTCGYAPAWGSSSLATSTAAALAGIAIVVAASIIAFREVRRRRRAGTSA